MEEFNIKGCIVKFFFDNEEIKINVSNLKSIISYETSIDLNNFNNSNDIEKNYELIHSYFKKYSNTEINSVENKNKNNSVETTHVNSPDNISLPIKSMFSNPINNSGTESPFGAVLRTNNGGPGFLFDNVSSSTKNESVFSFEDPSTKSGFGAPSSNNSCFGGAQFGALSSNNSCFEGTQFSNNSCFGSINNQKQRDIIFHLDFGVLKITFVQHSISIFLKERKIHNK